MRHHASYPAPHSIVGLVMGIRLAPKGPQGRVARPSGDSVCSYLREQAERGRKEDGLRVRPLVTREKDRRLCRCPPHSRADRTSAWRYTGSISRRIVRSGALQASSWIVIPTAFPAGAWRGRSCCRRSDQAIPSRCGHTNSHPLPAHSCTLALQRGAADRVGPATVRHRREPGRLMTPERDRGSSRVGTRAGSSDNVVIGPSRASAQRSSGSRSRSISKRGRRIASECSNLADGGRRRRFH